MGQDLEPGIGREPGRTPEQLLAIIKQSPDFEVFRRCLDDGGLVRSDNPYQPFEANGEQFGKVLDENRDVFDKHQRYDEEGVSLQIPDSFDMEAEAKKAFKVVVRILYQSGFIDVAATRGAAQFVGPASIIVNQNENTYHHFGPTSEFHNWVAENEIKLDKEKYGKTTPYPPTKERGKYFVLEIGGGSIRNKAAQNIKDANEFGIQLTSEQALRLDLVHGIGHEYGHGVKRAYDNYGVLTQRRSLELGYLAQAVTLGVDIDTLHDEKFACSIEKEVETHYLEQLGFSRDQAVSFMGRYDELRGRITEAAYAFLEYMRQKGLTPLEILQLESYVLIKGSEYYGKDIWLWRPEDALAYITPPYREDQFKKLTQR